MANKFLCHMGPPAAVRYLRNIARLVRPHGYLFVSGVDLDVRTKAARALAWRPLQELLEEIHEGDPCMKTFWPCHYAGLEPLNKRRKDWRLRYTAAFQVVPSTKGTIDNVCSGSVNGDVSEAAAVADEPTSISAAHLAPANGHGECG